MSPDARLTLPAQVSPRSSRSARCAPHALARRRGASRSRCCPADGGGRRGPARARRGRGSPTSSASTCSPCSSALGHRQGRRGDDAARSRSAAPDNADLRLVLLVGVGDAAPDDLRRAGAALARAHPRPRRAWPPRSPRRGRTPRARGLRRGRDARLLRLPLALRTRPSTRRSAGSCWPACPTPTTARDDAARGPSRSAAPAGGPGCSPRCPSNLKNPQWLAEQAARLAPSEAGLDVTVWDEQQLADEGFGGIVGVGQASATPPRLIRLDYTPAQAARRKAPHGRAGRQGHHLRHRRPVDQARRGAWSTMKRDMTGGARRASPCMGALADVDCPVRVDRAGRRRRERRRRQRRCAPATCSRHYGGRTTEVTNTDAEGRLVLADALAYAVDKLEPDVARRRRHADRRDEGRARPADRRLLRQRRRARRGAARAPREAAGEPLWRMPLGRRLRGASSPPRSPTPTTPPAAPARSPRRCSSSTSSATCRGPTSTSPRSATRPTSTTSGPTGPTGFGARACWLARPGGRGLRRDRRCAGVERWRRRRGSHAVRRHGGCVQDLADAPGVVRGLLRLRDDEPAAFQDLRRARSRQARSAAVPTCDARAMERGSGRTRGPRPAGSGLGVQTFLATSSPSPTGSSTGTRSSWSATAWPSSRIATVSSSRWAGSATRSCHSALSKATTPPGRSSRSASLR